LRIPQPAERREIFLFTKVNRVPISISMCELLGMSANTPTDLVFSFSALMERGGRSADHKDGWGVCFYDGKGIRQFHDASPGCESPVADFIRNHPIRSKTSIAHIRKANRGRVTQVNTHPFIREIWGEYWVFAHNGQIKGIKDWKLESHYAPVGTTDSERLFCFILGKLKKKYPIKPKDSKEIFYFLNQILNDCQKHGIMNLIFSDGNYLYSYCSTKLHYITRKAPFGLAELSDIKKTVDFRKVTTPKDIVTVIATTPLTKNETWTKMEKADFIIFKGGIKVSL
jgi:predicted glutamine amidotransferase